MSGLAVSWLVIQWIWAPKRTVLLPNVALPFYKEFAIERLTPYFTKVLHLK